MKYLFSAVPFLTFCVETLIEVWALLFQLTKRSIWRRLEVAGLRRAGGARPAEVGCNCYIKQTRPNMSCQLSFRLSPPQSRSPSSIHLLRGPAVPHRVASSASSAAEAETFVVVAGDRLINRVGDCCPSNYQLTCGVNRLVVPFRHCLLLDNCDIFLFSDRQQWQTLGVKRLMI